LANGYKLECFVDENGKYMRNLGPQLYGKCVLDEGNKIVLEMFKKHVVHVSDHIHSYPYDWRTKKVDSFKFDQLFISKKNNLN
jgi:isoleucyl-tRNA synthetase